MSIDPRLSIVSIKKCDPVGFVLVIALRQRYLSCLETFGMHIGASQSSLNSFALGDYRCIPKVSKQLRPW